MKGVSSPVSISLYLSCIIIDLFLKHARNFDRSYSLVYESKCILICKIPSRDNHELAL